MTDEQLTAIYNEANGITGKRLPITTQRIFKAMLAAMEAEREACAKVCDVAEFNGKGAHYAGQKIRERPNG